MTKISANPPEMYSTFSSAPAKSINGRVYALSQKHIMDIFFVHQQFFRPFKKMKEKQDFDGKLI